MRVQAAVPGKADSVKRLVFLLVSGLAVASLVTNGALREFLGTAAFTVAMVILWFWGPS